MIKFFISLLILINASALGWCGFNYATLSSVESKDAIYKINKTPDLANQSLQTMLSYSNQYKRDHVDEIISHYKGLAEHLELTKDMTIEVTDVLFRYLYIFLALSFINVLSFLFLLVRNREYFGY